MALLGRRPPWPGLPSALRVLGASAIINSGGGPHLKSSHSFFTTTSDESTDTQGSSSVISKERRTGKERFTPGVIALSHPQFMVWGANTGVGKTLASAGLVVSLLKEGQGGHVAYVKPVQTGYPPDSDSHLVARTANALVPRVTPTLHAPDGAGSPTKLELPFGRTISSRLGDDSLGQMRPTLFCTTLRAWEEPVSPHLAALRESASKGQSDYVTSDRALLQDVSDALQFSPSGESTGASWAVIETAGGVASPGPSGSLQCDMYRPFRFPAVLVGDSRLGGISSTISAVEALRSRGYDIAAVVLADSKRLDNDEFLRKYLRSTRVPVVTLPPLPEVPQKENTTNKIETSQTDPPTLPSLLSPPDAALLQWLSDGEGSFLELSHVLGRFYEERVACLRRMKGDAAHVLWWPFTQHGLGRGTGTVGKRNSEQLKREASTASPVLVMDSRCGELICSFQEGSSQSGGKEEGDSVPAGVPFLKQSFDGCASWWTQGPSPEVQVKLAQSVGYAAGRYGHVIFPENAHEPAVELARTLLKGVGKGWADRVFYSDNGSTGIEVAIKMGLRSFAVAHQEALEQRPGALENLKVIGLRGSYHGDTLGAMEAQAPSPFTGPRQQPWYRGQGIFLDAPTVALRRHAQGVKWGIDLPKEWGVEGGPTFDSFDEVLDLSHRSSSSSPSREAYQNYIATALAPHLLGTEQVPTSSQVGVAGMKQGFASSPQVGVAGSLILEPVLHGAGGMEMIDPLFQRTLVEFCRHSGIPVIFDEVFSGCWRFGRESAAEFLGCSPDIACYSKLLTGGIVPLAATLASKEVFEAFLSDSKLDALLHGHSYTAHAIGCSAALTALQSYTDTDLNQNYDCGRHKLNEMWDEDLVKEIASLPSVARVVHIGTVFALELLSTNSGYASSATFPIVQKLRDMGIYVRPLGSVLYIMSGPFTPRHTCRSLLSKLKEVITLE